MRVPKLFSETFDFFLPRLCPACSKKLKHNEDTVCSDCLNKIKFVENERLEYEFKKKFEGKKIISGFKTTCIFEKDKELQNIMHAMKYQNRFKIGIFLGKFIGRHLAQNISNWNIGVISPVPLHPLKNAERGYNQSLYISKGLSEELSIPFSNNTIKRKRFTESQTRLNILEREKNVKGAFSIGNSKRTRGKNILLIDDVITTGATINECGDILLKNGAKAVYAASVAIAD
jgi:ComF family protein